MDLYPVRRERPRALETEATLAALVRELPDAVPYPHVEPEQVALPRLVAAHRAHVELGRDEPLELDARVGRGKVLAVLAGGERLRALGTHAVGGLATLLRRAPRRRLGMILDTFARWKVALVAVQVGSRAL